MLLILIMKFLKIEYAQPYSVTEKRQQTVFTKWNMLSHVN